MIGALDSKVPPGPLDQKWRNHRDHSRLVNPNNRRKLEIIVIGSGLAGGSAAATLGELGYRVKCFCFQYSPRRAHSIAAQGGINAAKNYQNDGDSVYRLFYDTIKGGDFRSREANVYRLAEIANNIIDQCVAQGVPFAREYSGYLANRSFGGAQVSRTFYARGQTGQQLLLGCYQALCHQVASGTVGMFPYTEMLDLVIVNGQAKGIVTRNLRSGKMERHAADAVVLASGGYGNVFYLSTNARGSNVTATYRAYKRGALFANPSFTQIHPTCIPVSGDYQSKLTLMSESLRNDGRVWVPKKAGDTRPPDLIPEDERDYYLERKYPSYGNLAPRDIASRAAKQVCDEGLGVGPGGLGVNEVRARTTRFLGINGSRTVDSFHRELGRIMWEHCGMARTDASLREALQLIPSLREQFWQDVRVPGENGELNQELEKAGRVADFLELGELICIDALHRTESCGGHFREESQTEDGEALRDDEHFSYVAAWMSTGDLSRPKLVKEPLEFENIHLAQRSYK